MLSVEQYIIQIFDGLSKSKLEEKIARVADEKKKLIDIIGMEKISMFSMNQLAVILSYLSLVADDSNFRALMIQYINNNDLDSIKDIVTSTSQACMQENKQKQNIIRVWNSTNSIKDKKHTKYKPKEVLQVAGIMSIVGAILSSIRGDKTLDCLIGIPISLFISIIFVIILRKFKIKGN